MTETDQRSGTERGRAATGRSSRAPWYLSVYRTGLILLAFLLLGIARGSVEQTGLHVMLPALDSILAVWCLLHFGVLAIQYRGHRSWPSPRAQVSADLICALSLIWCTGGVDSFFIPVLLATIVAVSLVFETGRSILIATTSVLTLMVMTGAQSLGWSPAQWLGVAQSKELLNLPTTISLLVGQGIAIHCIAFLGARLLSGLRRAVRINDLIVENIGEGILALNERGRVILQNQEVLRIFGFSRDTDWTGKRPDEVLRRGDDEAVLEVLGNLQPGEFQVEWTLRRQEKIPLTIRVTRISEDSRGRHSWVAVIRDRTLENRAAAAEAQVRHLEEMEDLARGLVHEIRNPLASIRGCVQELGRGNVDPSQAERFMRIVLRESDRLDRIVDEFLEFSRTSPTLNAPVDLSDCLSEVVESLRGRGDALEVGIRLEAVAGPDGDKDEPVVLGHREMIYRVFLNLGVNALEAMKGHGSLTFRTWPGRPHGWEVVVEDDGPGMSEDVRRRVFNPFFSTKPREGGLGLALVERIVHGHGGSVEVESEEGVGTQFRVWLPGCEARQDAAKERELAAGVTV